MAREQQGPPNMSCVCFDFGAVVARVEVVGRFDVWDSHGSSPKSAWIVDTNHSPCVSEERHAKKMRSGKCSN